MFSNPQFWVFVAFIIFVIVIFKPLHKMTTLGLDKKINEIINSINKAEKINNEAQQALNEIKKRQNDVKEEIETINNNAKEKIILIEQQFNQKLDEQIKRRKALAKVKIEQITRDANLQIKQYIIQNVIKATFKILEKKLDQSEKQALINQSISELNTVLKY